MSKYVNLGEFLRGQKTSAVRMSFAEVERIIGHALPRSARYPAWWSNNPSNNVMTQVWLDAGFKTEHVNIEAKKLVFRRMEHAPSVASSAGMADAGRPYKSETADNADHASAHSIHPAFGSMKGLITIAPGVDLT